MKEPKKVVLLGSCGARMAHPGITGGYKAIPNASVCLCDAGDLTGVGHM